MKSGLREVRIASAALALTLVGGPASAATNLFTNGTFEIGNLSGWKVLNQGFSGLPTVEGSVGGIAPEDGKFQAVLTGSARQIVQTVKDTPGENISFTFCFETGYFSGWTVLNTMPSPNSALVTTNLFDGDEIIKPEDGKFEAVFEGFGT